MSGLELRAAIRALLETHPDLAVSSVGHVAHVWRYMSSEGSPIGLEPERVRFQNIWVRADTVRLHKLGGIDKRLYPLADFHKSKPKHDLYGEARFQNADLICFKVTNLWQAVRVITEVVGTGESA